MTSFFNFKNIEVNLSRELSSLEIIILEKKNSNNPIQDLILTTREILKILDWACQFVEITSIYFHGLENFSLKGLPLIKTTHQTVMTLFKNVQEIVYSMLHLPQTIITDYKSGAKDIGIELGLGADIKIALHECILEFKHLEIGLTPGCGLLGVLTKQINTQTLKNWLLLSESVKSEALLSQSFISLCYEKSTSSNNLTVNNLLLKIKNQSNIARIQTKRAFLDTILVELEPMRKKESSYLKSSLASGDLYNYLINKDNFQTFMTAKNFSTILKNETMV